MTCTEVVGLEDTAAEECAQEDEEEGEEEADDEDGQGADFGTALEDDTALRDGTHGDCAIPQVRIFIRAETSSRS